MDTHSVPDCLKIVPSLLPWDDATITACFQTPQTPHWAAVGLSRRSLWSSPIPATVLSRRDARDAVAGMLLGPVDQGGQPCSGDRGPGWSLTGFGRKFLGNGRESFWDGRVWGEKRIDQWSSNQMNCPVVWKQRNSRLSVPNCAMPVRKKGETRSMALSTMGVYPQRLFEPQPQPQLNNSSEKCKPSCDIYRGY